MTELERALTHIKTRADAWAVKEIEKALSQEPKTQMVDKSNFDIEQYKMDLRGAYDCGFEAGKKAEQEPCDDAVSREEAITAIRHAFSWVVPSNPSKEVRKMFIKCKENIRNLPPVNAIQRTSNASKDVEQRTNTLGDAVSREAVIKLFNGNIGSEAALILHMVKQLPSVTQKYGKWIGVNPMVDTLMCSECGENIISADFKSNFCPNCGAEMESEDKE